MSSRGHQGRDSASASTSNITMRWATNLGTAEVCGEESVISSKSQGKSRPSVRNGIELKRKVEKSSHESLSSVALQQ